MSYINSRPFFSQRVLAHARLFSSFHSAATYTYRLYDMSLLIASDGKNPSCMLWSHAETDYRDYNIYLCRHGMSHEPRERDLLFCGGVRLPSLS